MSGTRLMVASAFSFSLMSLFVKLVGATLPSQEIVLVRGLVTLSISFVALRAAGVPVGGGRVGLLALRGLFGFAAVSAFFYAVIHLPLADATVLHYTHPAFTAAIAALVLRESFGSRDAVGLGASLVGVLLITRPTFLFGGADAPLDPLGVGAALLGALLSACAYGTVRKLAGSEHPLVIVLWFGVVTTLGSTPATAADFVLPTGWLWAGLLGVGVATHLGQVFLTRGLAVVPAGRAMTISCVQIVFASLWGIMVFGERPDVRFVVGTALIVGSTMYLGRGEREEA